MGIPMILSFLNVYNSMKSHVIFVVGKSSHLKTGQQQQL